MNHLDLHPLALCCQVLYDKQVLEDATRLTVLEEQCKRLEMKYKYTWICQKDSHHWLRSTILTKLIEGKFTDGLYCSNQYILEHLLSECGVHYVVDDKLPRRVLNVKPYTGCVMHSCEILLVKSDMCNRLYVGTEFWKASSFKEQQRVYFFKYVLEQVFAYLPENSVDEGSILFIVHNCLLPYRNNTKEHHYVPQDMLTFEEYIEADVRDDLLDPL